MSPQIEPRYYQILKPLIDVSKMNQCKCSPSASTLVDSGLETSLDLLSGLTRLRLVRSSSCLLLRLDSEGRGVQSSISMLSGDPATTDWLVKGRAGLDISILQGAGVHSSMLTTSLDTAGVHCSGPWIRHGSDSAPDVNRSRRMAVAPVSGTWNVKLTLLHRPGAGRL